MDKDIKTYFKRTWCIQLGMILPQILFFLFMGQSIFYTIVNIAILELLVLGGYTLIFGIKQKYGSVKRLKFIDNIMKPHEDLKKYLDEREERNRL